MRLQRERMSPAATPLLPLTQAVVAGVRFEATVRAVDDLVEDIVDADLQQDDVARGRAVGGEVGSGDGVGHFVVQTGPVLSLNGNVRMSIDGYRDIGDLPATLAPVVRIGTGIT